MRQIFLPKSSIDLARKEAVLEGNAYHHLVHVLRKKSGDTGEVFDGEGNLYSTTFQEMGPDRALLRLEDKLITEIPGTYNLVVAVAILKGKKMHWLVQKLTEIGVHAIVPLVTRRTVARPDERESQKNEKWAKIAVEAAKQCGRTLVPDIASVTNLKDFWPSTAGFDAKLFAWEGYSGAKNASLNVSMKRWAESWKDLGRQPSILLMVGPEGGFDPAEVEQAKKHGFTTFGLGKNILRSETAALIASAIVSYELENRVSEQLG